jgi:hypothetical protein
VIPRWYQGDPLTPPRPTRPGTGTPAHGAGKDDTMRSGRFSSRCETTALLLCTALLGSGCATASRVALSDAQRANVGSARTLASLGQKELDVSVVASTGGAAVGGLIGAIIDSAVTNSRGKTAEAAVAPIRDALVEVDAGAALKGALTTSLAPVPWLKGSAIELRSVKANREAMAEAVQQVGTDAVLMVQADYKMSPTFDAMNIGADVSLLPRATPKVAKPRTALDPPEEEAGPPAPLYANRVVVSVRLPGFVAGTTTLDEAAKLWASAPGQGARRALEGGMVELAQMIAFDLEQAGLKAGARLYEAPPGTNSMKVPSLYGNVDVSGYIEKAGAGRSWLRLASGNLVSVGFLYQ